MYAAALLGIIPASFATAAGAFEIVTRLSDGLQRGWWTGYLLNLVAPSVGGVIVGMIVTGSLIRSNRFAASVKDHFRRAIAWYGFAILTFAMIAANWSTQDFWLWAQLILWPLAGTVGALGVDLTLTLRRRVVGRVAA